MLEKKKTAVVYDWLDKWGGVERVLLTFHQMYPEADFFTSYFDPKKAAWAKNLKIKTSFIQKLPGFIKESRIASLPFYPYAFETFDFRDYGLVISVTSTFAKSIITQPGTKHICYLLTPPRFLWSHQNDYFKENFLNRNYSESLKEWDLVASQRPDKIISISEAVKERCKKYYKRNSEVLYPPFDVDYWEKIKSKLQLKSKNFFLIVSRLESYKKVDLAVRVFNKLRHNLIIVGEGSEESNLRRISGKNINFLSKLTDAELGRLYSEAEALIMPQSEDFGYVSLESQFFGAPVISYKKSGSAETIIEGRTGIFFEKQTEGSLRQAIERYGKIKYNLKRNCKGFGLKNIMRFDKNIFVNSFKSAV